MTMASVNHICHLCEEEHVSNVAVVWCADCETFLCKDCERHHSKNRASKGHQTITLDDYKNLPSFIVDIKSRCEKHDEKYDFYCRFHDDPCCVKCIKDYHKGCRDLEPLVDVLRDIKASAKVSNLDKEFGILLENFDMVVKYVNSRIATLQENKTASLKEIRNLRASINDHLDKIEKKIVDDLSQEFNKIKLKFDHLTNEIKNKKKVIQNLQNDLSKMTNNATDLQMYVGLRVLEKSTSIEAGYLHDLQRTGELDDVHIKSKLSSDFKFLTFGNVVMHSSPCNLLLQSTSNYQVQLSVPHLLTIDSITPKLKTTLKIPKSIKDMKINGCHLLSDGRILILDGKGLLLFSKDGDYTENAFRFQSNASGICYIKDNLIAVTISSENKILLFDLLTKNVTKTIRVTDDCYGIDSNGEILVVNLNRHFKSALLVLDLDGNILSKIKVAGRFIVCNAICEDSIVCTDWYGSFMSCYTIKGALLWTYDHENIQQPYDVTVDKQGFIYVISRKNETIAVLSKDGKSSKTILSKDNGIVNPNAIHIDKTSSKLLVSNYCNGDAFVFKI